MSIYKDNATGKWRVVYCYTDWTGETHQASKRGFPTIGVKKAILSKIKGFIKTMSEFKGSL